MNYIKFLLVLYISKINGSCISTCNKILKNTNYIKNLILMNFDKLDELDDKVNIILKYIPPSNPPFAPLSPLMPPSPPSFPPIPINPTIGESPNLIIRFNLLQNSILLIGVCILLIIFTLKLLLIKSCIKKNNKESLV